MSLRKGVKGVKPDLVRWLLESSFNIPSPHHHTTPLKLSSKIYDFLFNLPYLRKKKKGKKFFFKSLFNVEKSSDLFRSSTLFIITISISDSHYFKRFPIYDFLKMADMSSHF